MKPEPGWYPADLGRSPDGELHVRWQNLSGISFTDPFFEDTLRRARHPDKPPRCTALTELLECSAPPSAKPGAFIFHASRCGSTLLAQLLRTMQGHVVIPEPPILDAVLRLDGPAADRTSLVRNTVHWLGQIRQPGDGRLFLKLDSWHLPWLTLIRDAFPGTPCWFLYRNPLEILESHHRQRGSQMVPGLLPLSIFGLTEQDHHPADLDGFAAKVLTAVLHQAAGPAAAGDLTLLNYAAWHQDPSSMLADLGLVLSMEEKEAMGIRSGFDSKNPHLSYLDRNAPPPPSAVRHRLEELSAPALLPAYDRLEQLRTGRPFTSPDRPPPAPLASMPPGQGSP